MDYAVGEIQKGNTYHPYEAIVTGLQRYLTKNKFVIISEQEYACFLEQQKYIEGEGSSREAYIDPSTQDVT